MKSFNVKCYVPIKTIMLIVTVYVGWCFLGAAPESLIYDRTLISQGEVWRLVTAHFVHVDSEHLILNLSALFILGALLEYLNSKLFLPTLLLGILSVSTGVWFGMGFITYYCGLSGVLNSLFIVLVWQLWNIAKDPLIIVLAVASLVKIVIEIKIGNSLFSSIAWPPLPEAHLFGFMGGLILLTLYSTKPAHT